MNGIIRFTLVGVAISNPPLLAVTTPNTKKQRVIRLRRKRGIENGVPDSLIHSVLLQQKSSAYALLFHIGY